MSPPPDDAPRVLVSVVDGIGHLDLDRAAKRNAIDARMVDDMGAALDDLVDAGVSVAILGSAGEVFCAGGDRSERGTGARSATDLAMVLLSRPIFIAARVHGGAVGGGVALAAVCPLVVCTPDAWFDLPEARAGFLPTPVLALLEPTMGAREALRLCLFPARIDAPHAVELGLAEQIVSANEIDAHLISRLLPLARAPLLAAAAAASWQSRFRTDAFRSRFAELLALLPPEVPPEGC